jgi:hypothetical protein
MISTRTGAAWFSLLIEPERDGAGNHVTIQPEYIGRDETANYLQTRELPKDEARSLFEVLSQTYRAAGGLSTYTNNQGKEVGIVRISIEKARELEANSAFIGATNESSLLQQIRDEKGKGWAEAITPTSTPSEGRS